MKAVLNINGTKFNVILLEILEHGYCGARCKMEDGTIQIHMNRNITIVT